jgi:hypothetical protein
MRIVGGAMVLGTLLALGTSLPAPARDSPTILRAAALLPALLGIGLILNHEWARRTTIVVSALGLAGSVAFGIGTHFWILVVPLFVFCGTYLMLLVGEPGWGRLISGSVVLLTGLVATFLVRGGSGTFAAKVLQWGDEIESDPVERVEGPAWRFQTPPRLWYTSKRSFPGFEEDPDTKVERVLVRPEGSAVVFLISKKIPSDRGFDLDALADGISRTWAKKFSAFKLHGISPLPGRGGTRVLHMSARIDNADFEALWGLYPNAPVFHALMVGASPRVFTALRGELEGILASFQSDTPPPEPTPTPTDEERILPDSRLRQPVRVR